MLLVSGMTPLTLNSSAFYPHGTIPTEYTCEGNDNAPPLQWSGVPDGTRSFVLIVDDPDAPDPAAPRKAWVHWIVYNIPARATAIPAKDALPPGAECALNDWNRRDYGGPCPPVGRHRYVFKLYALDTELPHLPNARKSDIESAIEGHVLAKAELVGAYEKVLR